MAKTLSVGLQAKITNGTAQLCRIYKIIRQDGTVHRFTDHNEDVVVPSDGTYTPSTAVALTEVSSHLTQGSGAADLLVTFSQSGDIAKSDVRAGLYRNAVVLLDAVDWSDPSLGTVNLFTGWVGPFTGSDRQTATAQMNGFSQKAINRIGENYSPECRANLGDARCGVNRATFSTTGTVTLVTGNFDFVATMATNPAAGEYSLGIITWSTGNNAGSSMEILEQQNYDATDDRLLLAQSMPYDVQIGDTFTAYMGCDKRPETCTNKFSNIINFRGEPFVPGPDFISDTPEPI
jgi:uncharacterized phage protein (TIGR02218 family)